MKQKREKVGKIARDLMIKAPDTQSPIEQGAPMTQDYMSNLRMAVKRGKELITKDFFVVVITKKEPKLWNVVRNYFLFRNSCPTPDYDQAVYHYHPEDDRIDLLWVIPARDKCFELKRHAAEIPLEYAQLLTYVLDFADGTLFKQAALLNKEDVQPGNILLREMKDDQRY